MQRSTNLLRRAKTEGIAPAKGGARGLGYAPTSGFNYGFNSGSGSGWSSFDFTSNLNSGGSLFSDFNFGSTLNSGSTFGELNFGSMDPTQFDMSYLSQNAFGQNAPLADASTPLREGSPDQDKVPDMDNWKEFVGFLFKNGPAWVRAFQNGDVRAPSGAKGPTGDSTSSQRRAMLYRAIQQAEGKNGGSLLDGGGGGSWITSQQGLLVVGGLALGGVLLAAVASSGGAPQYRPRPRPAPPRQPSNEE